MIRITLGHSSSGDIPGDAQGFSSAIMTQHDAAGSPDIFSVRQLEVEHAGTCPVAPRACPAPLAAARLSSRAARPQSGWYSVPCDGCM